jgi:hypothetical protein
VHNMKQKIVGLPKDEWKDAARLLKTYAEMRCTVKILHDEDIITTIFVQTKTQKELFFFHISRSGFTKLHFSNK